MINSFLRLSALFALTGLVSAAHADTVIDTYPAAGGFLPFGTPYITTYGQTFTVPAGDTTLANFQLTMRSFRGTPGEFRFYVANWSGDRVLGSPLYQSPIVLQPSDKNGDVDYLFTPEVSLNAGTKYVAFISTSGLPGTDGQSFLYGRVDNPYSGGGFVFTSDPDPAIWTSDAWYTGIEADRDMSFRATFVTAVPEPGAAALMMGIGLAGLGFVSRRRALRR